MLIKKFIPAKPLIQKDALNCFTNEYTFWQPRTHLSRKDNGWMHKPNWRRVNSTGCSIFSGVSGDQIPPFKNCIYNIPLCVCVIISKHLNYEWIIISSGFKNSKFQNMDLTLEPSQIFAKNFNDAMTTTQYAVH